MSTNYYLLAKPACVCCGRDYERLHIGKASAGWTFALRVYPEGEGPRSLAEWVALFPDGIVSQYGEKVSPEKMIEIITRRQPNAGHPLHRHQPREWRGVERGGDTYDLLESEFS